MTDKTPPLLTDEQIDKLRWGPHEGNPVTFAEGLRDFARAVEAAVREQYGAACRSSGVPAADDVWTSIDRYAFEVRDVGDVILLDDLSKVLSTESLAALAAPPAAVPEPTAFQAFDALLREHPPTEADRQWALDALREMAAVPDPQPVAWWPDTPQKVIDFIGPNFEARVEQDARGRPLATEDWRITLSVHDMLSALHELADLAHPAQPEQQVSEPITDAEQAALYRHCEGTQHYSVVRKLYQAAAAQPDLAEARDAERLAWIEEHLDMLREVVDAAMQREQGGE